MVRTMSNFQQDGGGSLAPNAARDGLLLLPDPWLRGNGPGTSVLTRLAGAAVMRLQKVVDPPYIDWYEVWYWVDVNNNGAADEGDKIDGTPQEWHLLMHVDGAPSNYDTVKGTAKIGNLLPEPGKEIRFIDRDGKEQVRYPVTGPSSVSLANDASYLLVIRVYARDPLNTNDLRSSLQFASPVTCDPGSESVTVEMSTPLLEEGWDTSGPKAYIGKEGKPAAGVSDSEVLWIRIAGPPGPPPH